MNNDYLFSVRLKEERKRLKLSQAEAGEAVAISREMWGKYERGAKPGTDIFMAMERAGFNTNYILAGRNLLDVKLTAQEVVLIDKFRLSTEQIQAAVINLLDATTQKKIKDK
ncbi:MAG: helix-turn-helix transcriptional regulator [Methylotenera sp.]|nr:helix-turn-helix transcriptional regulator [Methylotenera sp.]